MHQVQDNGKMDRIGPVDIVACGSTLSSLLRFVLGQRQSFRMQVEAIDETVHLIRRSGSPLETIPDIRGYGHTFPEANTTWDSCVKGSVSHQRILSYQFGGLGCIVRFEGDGYLLEKAGELRTEAQAKGSQSNKTVNSTSLEALADGLALSTSNQYTKPEGPVKIQSGGSLIPQNAIYDLKTRSIRRKPEEQAIIAEEIPRLWVKQITNFILAFHRSGTFEDIQVHDLGLAIEEWEFVNRDALERFRALLQLIMDEASQRKDGKLEVICNEEEQLLHIREQGPGCQSALSPDVERRWKHWLDKCRSAKGGLTGKSDNQGGAPLFWEEDYVLDRDYDSEDAKDFTACDLECGYCGRCDY
jgi:hypothetical protein